MAASPWWQSGIIYQIYPRSFQDDGQRGVGTIKGIIDRMDYLGSLGITAVWISPFFRSPMHDFGYDVTDHKTVDPMFGTDEDFDALITAAHRRNIRIIIDLVLSHTSIEHPWFLHSRQSKDNPMADYYVWADAKSDGTPPNNWLSIFGGVAWTWEPRRQQYYLHNFLSTQPDLNFHHPDVQAEALSIAQYWLDRGVDGFRLDTVNFYFHDAALRNNPPNQGGESTVVSKGNPYGYQNHIYDKNRPEVVGFLKQLGALLARYSGRMALGEVGADWDKSTELIRQYVQPQQIQLCYSFDLLSARFSAAHIKAFIRKEEGAKSPLWPCLAMSNHDVVRTASRLQQPNSAEAEIAPLAMALLLSLKGTPCVYQGEELGLPEADVPFEALVDPYGKKFYPEYKGRDGCRTPMPWTSVEANCGFTHSAIKPWLPIAESHRKLAADTQETDATSMLNLTRALVKIRQATLAFQQDTFRLLESPKTRIEFVRGDPRMAVYCAFNLSATGDQFTIALDLRRHTKRLAGSTGIEYSNGVLRLPPWGFVWLQFEA